MQQYHEHSDYTTGNWIVLRLASPAEIDGSHARALSLRSHRYGTAHGQALGSPQGTQSPIRTGKHCALALP